VPKVGFIFGCDDLVMAYTGPHTCPNCGERVSAFAAGCALCGAELDPRRGQAPPTVADRTRRLFGSLSPRGGQRKRSGDGRTT
jgi:predicted amidophosphoribosyltransferase